jgi:hypothetical protein
VILDNSIANGQAQSEAAFFPCGKKTAKMHRAIARDSMSKVGDLRGTVGVIQGR